jgi:hypothetical protein
VSAPVNPHVCRVSRDEAQGLLEECQAYIGAIGLAPSTFGYRSCKRASLITDLKIGMRPTRRTAERLRAWMTAHPLGTLDEMHALDAASGRAAKDAEAAALDARRAETIAAREDHVRRCARREAEAARPSLGGAVQEKFFEGPGDAIRVIRARWPDLWSRVVEAARAQGALPGAVMVEAIERGLAA